MPGATIETLDSRVRSLENRFWVAVVVAAIFGVSGAWGFSMLHDAQKQLVVLEDGIGAVRVARDAAIQDIKDHAPTIAKQAVTKEMDGQIGAVKHWVNAIILEAGAGHSKPGKGVTAEDWRHTVAGFCLDANPDLENPPHLDACEEPR